MLPIDNDVNLALIDVRRAFRLLYVYQCRVIDVIEEIAARLGCRFYSQAFTSPKVRQLERPAALLPMWNNCFLYLPNQNNGDEIKKGDWMLSIRVISDTAFPADGWDSVPEVETLDSVENSKSVLALHSYLSLMDHGSVSWRYHIWDAIDWPTDGQTVTSDELKVKTYGQTVEIASLTKKANIEEISRDFAKQLNIHLGIRAAI